MTDTDIRRIEKEIDIFHKSHDAFKYARATAILNLLRSFEDGCRLIGPYEMAKKDSSELLEMNNRFFLDALDMAIKWAYCECTNDDTIDFTSDERYLCFSFLLMYNAKPYMDICSSYVSYSRGHFSAVTTDKNVIFSINKPIPQIINADYSIEIEYKYNYDKTKLVQASSQLKGVREEIISSINIDDGHVNYTITPNMWENTRKVLKLQYEMSREIPGEWVIDVFTLNEYCDVWVALSTWMMIHTVSCMFSGIPGGGLKDVVLAKTLDEIVQFVVCKTDISEATCSKIINLLVYDWNVKNNDVIYQPIIPLTSELYALSPHLFLNSNPERNLISIINKYQNKTEYSVFTNKRENLMAESIIREIDASSWLIRTNVKIPSPLPDIDLLIYDATNNAMLLCELKWLNHADSTSEVYARQDDIDKGVKQSEVTLKYAKENSENCLSRVFDKDAINKIDYASINIGACVISKNTIRTTLDSIPVINFKQFIILCRQYQHNLKQIIDVLEQRQYLSKLPDRYTERYQKIEYAGYTFKIPSIEFNAEVNKEKVGRNNPCPCGKVNPISGKPLKYKKCCGRNL